MQSSINNLVTTCCICSQIAGEKDNDLINNLLNKPSYIRRVILENDHFVVIPSLGALTEGHVIICPKIHIKSFALLDDEQFEYYQNIKEKVLSLLKKSYKKEVHFFEHGSAKGSEKLICTVDHAHIHIVPTNVEILDSIQSKYKWIRFDYSNENLSQLVGNNEYLFYETPNGESYLSLDEGRFQSQYLRKVFSEAMGTDEEWNWRQNPNPEFTHKIYADLFQES